MFLIYGKVFCIEYIVIVLIVIVWYIVVCLYINYNLDFGFVLYNVCLRLSISFN